MNWITIIGLTAGTCTTLSFLPQVIKSWRTRKTKDISFIMYSILGIGVILWLIYGLLIKDIPIIVANAVAVFLVSSILFLKVKYG